MRRIDMGTAKIDLHTHSICSSDGDFEPAELVYRAKKAGLDAIAVSDHNTTAAVKMAVEAGEEIGVRVIPAVELDCMLDGIIFHVLGYGIDPEARALAAIDLDIQCQEKLAAKTRIRLVNEAGIAVDEAEALAQAKDGIFVEGEIIAEIVLNKPAAADNPLLRPYLPGGSRSDNPYVNFFWDWCAQDRPAYVHIEYIDMRRAFEVIHDTGGVAVLAHPGKNLEGRFETLADIGALGLDGIECYSSYHTEETNEYFLNQAKKYDLLITGGSDFHGKTKPSIHMGQYGLPGDGLDLLTALDEAMVRNQMR